jgi:hypothetical protein
MAKSFAEVSEKIYSILIGTGQPVKLFTSSGKEVTNPREASRFVINHPYEILIRIDTDSEALIIKSERDISGTPLLTHLTNISNTYILNRDYQVFGKNIHAKRAEVIDAQQAAKDEAEEEIMENSGINKFGQATGSSRTSHQSLTDSISVVVKHRKRVEEERPGARSRNIESIYVRRGGERFRMAENSMIAARAMARHLENGGEFWDDIGNAINESALQARRLSRFVNYVNRSGNVNETNEIYVSMTRQHLQQIKSVLEGMTRPTGYTKYSDQIVALVNSADVETLEEDIEGAFVQTNVDDRVTNVMGDIRGLVSRLHRFQRTIDEAVSKEKFASLKNMLREADILDFADAKARLGYQVIQLSTAAQCPDLSNYLGSISEKISAGGELNQHEYGTVKRCLFAASNAQVNESLDEPEQTDAVSEFNKINEIALYSINFQRGHTRFSRYQPKTDTKTRDFRRGTSYFHTISGVWHMREVEGLFHAISSISTELQYNYGGAPALKALIDRTPAATVINTEGWNSFKSARFVLDDYVFTLNFTAQRQGSEIRYQWSTSADHTSNFRESELDELEASRVNPASAGAALGEELDIPPGDIETVGGEMLQIEVTNEQALDAIFSSGLGDEIDYSDTGAMVISADHRDRLEDLLMSMGFEPGEDYRIIDDLNEGHQDNSPEAQAYRNGRIHGEESSTDTPGDIPEKYAGELESYWREGFDAARKQKSANQLDEDDGLPRGRSIVGHVSAVDGPQSATLRAAGNDYPARLTSPEHGSDLMGKLQVGQRVKFDYNPQGHSPRLATNIQIMPRGEVSERKSLGHTLGEMFDGRQTRNATTEESTQPPKEAKAYKNGYITGQESSHGDAEKATIPDNYRGTEHEGRWKQGFRDGFKNKPMKESQHASDSMYYDAAKDNVMRYLGDLEVNPSNLEHKREEIYTLAHDGAVDAGARFEEASEVADRIADEMTSWAIKESVEKPNHYIISKRKKREYGVAQDTGHYPWDHSLRHGPHKTVDDAKAWAKKHAGKYPHKITIKEAKTDKKKDGKNVPNCVKESIDSGVYIVIDWDGGPRKVKVVQQRHGEIHLEDADGEMSIIYSFEHDFNKIKRKIEDAEAALAWREKMANKRQGRHYHEPNANEAKRAGK